MTDSLLPTRNDMGTASSGDLSTPVEAAREGRYGWVITMFTP